MHCLVAWCRSAYILFLKDTYILKTYGILFSFIFHFSQLQLLGFRQWLMFAWSVSCFNEDSFDAAILKLWIMDHMKLEQCTPNLLSLDWFLGKCLHSQLRTPVYVASRYHLLLSPSSTGHNYGHILCSDYFFIIM